MFHKGIYLGDRAIPGFGVGDVGIAQSVASGQPLVQGQTVTSPSGRAQLTMQGDGNLVLYDALSGPRALWASNTNGKGALLAYMQPDGNLVVYDADHQPLWASGTDGHPGAYLSVQDDGNIVVYVGSQPIWSSKTQGFQPPSVDFISSIAKQAQDAAQSAQGYAQQALSQLGDALNQAPWLRDAIYAAGDQVKNDLRIRSSLEDCALFLEAVPYFPEVRQVAVVGDRDVTSTVIDNQRLDIGLVIRGSCGRIPVMTHGGIAGEQFGENLVVTENVVHQTEVFVNMKPVPVRLRVELRRHDTGTLLTTMLQRMKSIIGQLGGLRVPVNAEHTAMIVWLVGTTVKRLG